MTRATIATISLLVICIPASASEVVREISWSDVSKNGELLSGDVVPATGEGFAEVLRIARDVSDPTTIPILSIDSPGITAPKYALVGQVRYENVEWNAYLEMLNSFSGGGTYFTRTLNEWGPLMRITGSSGWREFKLPFYIDNEAEMPNRLEFNLVQPKQGTVYLSPLRLVQFDRNEDPLANPGEWWTERGGGLVGAILGCFGGLIGCLGGIGGTLAARGRGRWFVHTVLIFMVVTGAALLVVGLVAVGTQQPYHVYYPFLLGGFLFFVLGMVFIPVMRKRYAESELRKMQAMDSA